MKKPEKLLDTGKDCVIPGEGYNEGYIDGYNEACDDWQAYHNWFIKEKCILKEDLLSAEEIRDDIYDMLMKRKDWQSIDFVRDGFDPHLFTERISVDLAQALVGRIKKNLIRAEIEDGG